ncbi:MAG: ComEA family DNA-binding protein [Thermoanaerobaculia bacterium]
MTLRPLARTLIVPVLGLSLSGLAAAAPTAETEPAKKVVNINTATAAELTRLPRVGERLAQRVVDHRQKQGAFRRAEDLMEVKGVGEKMFQTLKPYLAVSGPTTLAEKVSSKGSHGASKATLKAARPAKTPKNAKTTSPYPKEGA